jgi:diguanylate cyclase
MERKKVTVPYPGPIPALADPDIAAENVANMTVQQTLAEQMRLTSYEVANRKALLGLTEARIRALIDCRDAIHCRIDDIVQQFYAIQTRTPEIALVIGDRETLARLARAMRRYIMEMFSGEYDEDYVNKRLRIGKVHKRIGVSPKLYTTALRILHSLLDTEVREICGEDIERAETARDALNTIFMFDMQLVFDTYIASLVAEIESSKSELERYATGLEEQIRSRTREVEELSRMDMLTELINQRGFYEHLRRECSAVERGSEPLALIFLDLNDFKNINDSRGHFEGDRVLAEAGKIVSSSVRETDIACRYGGDEFAVLMPRTTLEKAAVTGRRMLENVAIADIDGLSFSIGIAVSSPEVPRGPDDLIRFADDAMYQAKLLYRKDQSSHLVLETETGGERVAALRPDR